MFSAECIFSSSISKIDLLFDESIVEETYKALMKPTVRKQNGSKWKEKTHIQTQNETNKQTKSTEKNKSV